MKKILFVCFMFIFNMSISKALEPRIEYLKDTYSNRMGDKLYSGQMGIVYLDNKLVYCVDPYLIIGKDYFVDNSYLDGITKSDLEYFEVISYYGYNETNRSDIYYYMAAQELIWERIIGIGNISWTSKQYGNGNTIDIDFYKNQIISDVQNYYLKPEFDKQLIQNDLFNVVEIYDNNYVINDFYLINEGKSLIDVDNNKLTIKVLDTEENEVKLKREYSSLHETTSYKSAGGQTLISFGLNRVVNANFYIKSYNDYFTNIGIKFYEKETGILIRDLVDFEIYNYNYNYSYIKDYYIEDNIYKYPYLLNEGIYQINLLSDEYVIDDSLKFEINEDKYMEKYTEFEFYIEKKKKVEEPKEIEEDNIDDKKEIEEDNINDEKEIEESIIKNLDINEENIILTKEATNNLENYELASKEENFTNENYQQHITDNLPNTYDYYLIIKIILAFVCLTGCVFYKI